MKRFAIILCGMLLSVAASAQDLFEQIKAANMPGETLQATWHQVKRSTLLVEDLVSEGRVYIQQPDMLRWETTSPVQRVSVMAPGQARGRFRLPTEKDFDIQIQEGEEYLVQLTPIRRDLKKMIGQIALHVDPASLKLRFLTMTSPEGDWTRIEFTDVKMDLPLSATLFE